MIQLLKEDSPQEKPMFNPSRPDPGRREKINVSFRFHTSLWCLKRFYEGLHKTL